MFSVDAQYGGLIFSVILLMFFSFLFVIGTPFLLVSICFSILRTAIGAPQTPPNFVLYGLSAALTVLIIQEPVSESIANLNSSSQILYSTENILSKYEVIDRSFTPYKGFINNRTNESKIMNKFKSEECINDEKKCKMHEILPSYTISELTIAFQLAYKIFIPFIIIDFLVSVILLALGMMMMPPSSFSLPIKLFFFFYADGWNWVSNILIEGYL